MDDLYWNTPLKWMIYNGNPYFLMDDLGGKPTIFGNIPCVFVCSQETLDSRGQCAQLGRDTGGFAQGLWLASKHRKTTENGGGKHIYPP